MAAYFGVSFAAVNLMAIVYLLAFPTLTSFTSISMVYFGLRKTVLIGRKGKLFPLMWWRSDLPDLGAGFEFLSGWIRLGGSFSSSTFWLVVIGQIIGALGQPFIGLNVVTLLSENWFPAGPERALSTTVSSLCAVVGGGVVFGVAPLIVRDVSWLVTLSLAQTRINDRTMKGSDFWILTLVEAASMTLLFIGIFVLFDERPPTPPSGAAAAAIRLQEDYHGKVRSDESPLPLNCLKSSAGF